jgi:exopolyphosphatase/guanosine-5'-triphosphate,3'-diphosphate pyrophosphatase
VLTTARIEELRDMLAALPLEERRRVPGLDPARAPTIVAGAILLAEAARRFALEAVEVSEHDILRGVALDTGN